MLCNNCSVGTSPSFLTITSKYFENQDASRLPRSYIREKIVPPIYERGNLKPSWFSKYFENQDGFRLPRSYMGGTIFSRIYERGNLEASWFSKYFDVIVRNEGEVPTEQLLHNIKSRQPLTLGVNGIVFVINDLITT